MLILLSALLVFSMAACNGGKEKADNKTEKQTESVKPTEEAEMATEAVTEVATEVEIEETEKDIAEAKDSEEKTDKDDFCLNYVTKLMKLEGEQKLVRFYDPSGNLIEVRTPVNYN